MPDWARAVVTVRMGACPVCRAPILAPVLIGGRTYNAFEQLVLSWVEHEDGCPRLTRTPAEVRAETSGRWTRRGRTDRDEGERWTN